MAKEKAKQAKGGAQGEAVAGVPAPRMRDRYRNEVVASMMKEFGYANVMEVPRLVKITINAGLGEAVGNPNVVKTATEEITAIAGQRAVVTRAKKSIANFKLRENVPIGCMVTLRRERMWEFFDRLVSVAMPRIRDFKGVSPKGFDGHGSYTLGLKEQTMFIEVVYDKVERQTGMNVSIVTTAKTDDEGRALLRHLGMPFRN